MTKVDIVARRVASTYRIPVTLSEAIVNIKLDTGSKYTVISASAINSELRQKDIKRIKEYCELSYKKKEKFISASGHSFYGYLVCAKNVIIDNSMLEHFYYYLVIENKKDIALLGYDFVDKCSFSHNYCNDIVITEYNESGYDEVTNALDSDELIAFMDSLE